MLSTSSGPATSGSPSPLVAIAWALVSGLLLFVHWQAIAALRFPDPDDIMRLVQVRDLLGGQNWFDITQYRLNASAGGVAMHWSRLIDLPIALIIAALSPFVGASEAELVALVTVPLLTLGAAMYLAARIAWRWLGREESLFTCLIMALSIPLVFQLSPLRIDHHGWQIVCALAAINGLMANNPRKGGWVIGGSLALWLSISIEGLPLAAAICGVLALRWLREPTTSMWLVSTMQALAAVSLGLFAATRGLADLATYCDAISPAHLAMFIWGAGVLTVLNMERPKSLLALLAGFAIAAGGALAMLGANAPQCIGGGFSELDPVVAEYWHSRVNEGMPVWRQSLPEIVKFAVAPLIGLFSAVNLARQSAGKQAQWWIDYALILGAAIAVSLLVARAGAVAGAIAAVPLAWQVRRWLRAIRVLKGTAPRIVATLAVSVALLPAFPLMVASWALPLHASGSSTTRSVSTGQANGKAASCNVAANQDALRTLERGEIFAMIDVAPHLLLASEHTVVATAHHRGDEGMRFVIETAMASEAEAQAALISRGTEYVALCSNLGEPRIYAHYAPDGFVAQLLDGRAPDWLEPIALRGDSALQMWRIKPE